jgi:hypothetical protein
MGSPHEPVELLQEGQDLVGPTPLIISSEDAVFSLRFRTDLFVTVDV